MPKSKVNKKLMNKWHELLTTVSQHPDGEYYLDFLLRMLKESLAKKVSLQ